MQQILASGLEVAVVNDYLYVPLLFDPSLAAEIQAANGSLEPNPARGAPAGENLLRVNGRYFIKALSLPSLLEHFHSLHPDVYNHLRDDFFQKNLGFILREPEISLDGKLQTIIFQIMPHFIRKKDHIWRGKKLDKAALLDLIRQKIEVPPKYKKLRYRSANPEFSRKLLGYLNHIIISLKPLQEGAISAHDLRQWFHQAITAQILQKEKDRWEQKIARDQQLAKNQGQKTEVLLFLAARGSLEIEGFGFSRIAATGEYFIYKRTGEYALKDYYGRLYLFPDCRVAVSTAGRLKPLVLEKYKHPFLRRHAPGQDICLRHFTPPPAFTAEAAVSALEEGITALFYGYNCRRRNGYHSLDRLPLEERLVDFEDYRITPDHPKISSGQVEIKNAYS